MRRVLQEVILGQENANLLCEIYYTLAFKVLRVGEPNRLVY